jgi:hypothetical protein
MTLRIKESSNSQTIFAALQKLVTNVISRKRRSGKAAEIRQKNSVGVNGEADAY